MWQSLEISNVFNNLTLKQIFWKMKTFFKKLENCFVVESTTIESIRQMLRQIEWRVQNAVLPVPTFFFWKFCFSTRTCYKALIWSTNYPNVHIHTFPKRWSFIWGCFFPENILKTYSASTIRNNFNMNVSCFMRGV